MMECIKQEVPFSTTQKKMCHLGFGLNVRLAVRTLLLPALVYAIPCYANGSLVDAYILVNYDLFREAREL